MHKNCKFQASMTIERAKILLKIKIKSDSLYTIRTQKLEKGECVK